MPPVVVRGVHAGDVGGDDDFVVSVRGEGSLAASVPTPASALDLTGDLIDDGDGDLGLCYVVEQVSDRVLAYSRQESVNCVEFS